MSDHLNISDPNSSRPAQALLRAVEAKLGSCADPWALIARLMTEAGREDFVHELAALAAMAGKIDPVRTMAWSQGGPAPFGDAADEDINGPPGELKHPRQRKGQSVGRMMSEARAGKTDVDRQIAKKETELADLKAKRARLDALGATAAIFGIFDALKKSLVVPLSFGPAFTVMRAVCGRVVVDPDVPIPGDLPAHLRDKQAFTYLQALDVQDVLADMVGDEAFELDLYRAIKAVTDKHKDRTAELTKQQKSKRLERAKAAAPAVIGSFGKRMSEADRAFVDAEMVLWRELPTPLELVDRNGRPTYDGEILERLSGRTRAALLLLDHGIGTLTGAAVGATVERERELRASAAFLADLSILAKDVAADLRPFYVEELAARGTYTARASDQEPEELPPFTGDELGSISASFEPANEKPFAGF